MSGFAETLFILGGTFVTLAWVLGGAALSVRMFERLEGDGVSPAASALAAVGAFVLTPLYILWVIRCLKRACGELYRYRFPQKTKLPRAEVHRG